jgi:hypothetical protein
MVKENAVDVCIYFCTRCLGCGQCVAIDTTRSCSSHDFFDGVAPITRSHGDAMAFVLPQHPSLLDCRRIT